VIDRDRSAARRGRARRAALALWLGLLAGLATPAASRADAGSDAGASATEARVRDPDPWEPMNRGIFWFNEKTDIYFVAPVARGWRFVVPGFARKGIENFNGLLVMPVVLGNGILQLKPKNAIQDVGRIVYNATFGIAGFIDVATMIGIPQNDEDFGQTLGYWGVGPGPYLVLPILGPSSLRDGVGYGVDWGIRRELWRRTTDLETWQEWTRDILWSVDTRAHIAFRYYETGSPFEYEMVRMLYSTKRELDIER
jgi:phospholipid-binding lipoprotein MlaA